jgi:hypothetical protein
MWKEFTMNEISAVRRYHFPPDAVEFAAFVVESWTCGVFCAFFGTRVTNFSTWLFHSRENIPSRHAVYE